MDVITVRDVKNLQNKVATCMVDSDNFIVDHGFVEVPEEKFLEIKQMLKDFFDILGHSIDNAEVFKW